MERIGTKYVHLYHIENMNIKTKKAELCRRHYEKKAMVSSTVCGFLSRVNVMGSASVYPYKAGGVLLL